MNKVSLRFDLQELLCEAIQKKAEASIGGPLDSYEIAKIKEIVDKHIIDDTISYQWQIHEEARRMHKDSVDKIIGESIRCCLAVVEAKYCDLISMPRLINNFVESHINLLEIVDDPIYAEQLAYNYKYFHASTLDFKTGRYTYAYLKSPQSYDPQKIGVEMFANIIEGYRKHWEDTISCMIKRPAIRDRRKCIVEELDEVLTNDMANQYPELMMELKKYQEFNANEIERIKQLIISKN